MSDNQKLKFLNEFAELIKNYKPSKDSLETLSQTNMILLVGPTAAGRNTLINILTDTGRYHYLISNTTRKPRQNNGVMEREGVEYWFKTEEEFLAGLKNGDYLEAAIIHNQQVSGISVAELKRANNSGKIAIDEVEVYGADIINGYKPDALFVFLLPPQFDVWMKRLKGRGHMSDSELKRRLESALKEISAALKADFYQFVINNEIHESAVAVDELANGRQPDEAKQGLGRDHAEQLVIDIRLYLESL